ncbi:MAG: cytochrome c biogenesis protein CcsA [Spirochaetia bacterium]|nr:cytochrome c biogenesis protein CcsA [Spirochaetia bacterium]
MITFENILIITAIILYAISFLYEIKKQNYKYNFYILITGLSMHLLSALIRWAHIGHPPVFGTYEAALQGSWFLALYVAFSRYSAHKYFSLMIKTALPMTIIILLYGMVFFDTGRKPLTLSEQSIWVDLHALFAWLAYAPFTLAFCLSGAYLWRQRKNNKITENEEPLVAHEIIDELSFKYINLGFISHTVMFMLGSYYSSILFGSWWQWDPAESTSLITWLSVALYIHLRLFYNWREKKAAKLYMVIFFTIIFSYWGLVHLPEGITYHVFDLEIKPAH